MRVPKLDLRTPEQKDEPKKKIGRFAIFFIVLFLGIGSVALSSNIVFSDHPIVNLGAGTFLGQLRSLVRSGERKLSGETSDRVNILILGVGGEGHDGPQLTDTVILASFIPSKNKVALISFPRDLAIATEEFGTVKLNAVNAYAESKKKGSGAEKQANALGKAIDQPINYWAKIDFRGFEKAIDSLGGIDVNVERAFTDHTYPVGDKEGNVKTIAFPAGVQHLNGARALEFARSRHGTNGEGSDFARSRRQEKIMLAVREKMLRAGTLLNPFTLNGLFDAIASSLFTNMETWEIIRLAQAASDVKSDDVSLKVMSDENILWGGINESGAYVLAPKNNDWSVIKEFAKNAFDEPTETKPTETKTENVRIMIQNGTKIAGLAQRTAESLKNEGFRQINIANAENQQYERTVVYDLTAGKSVHLLPKILSVVDGNVAPDIPASLSRPPNTDLLIILGRDANL
jgi:LCP family protein required for cell wall assembly